MYRLAMDESDINRLLMKVAGAATRVPEDARRVFSLLITSTLRYRDFLKRDHGTVLTVEDVRVTLDWLLEAVHTGRLPDSDDPVRLNLLKIWLDELRPFL